MIQLLFLFVLLFHSLASAQWTKEPAGSDVTVDCNMTAQGCPGQYTRGTWYDGYSSSLYQSDASAPISPQGYTAAKKTYTGPCNNGNVGVFEACALSDHGNDVGWWDNQTHREMYFGLSVRFEAGGNNVPGATKSFFPRSLNVKGSFAQTNGVFYWGGTNATTRSFYFGPNTSGLDNSHTCGAGGNSCFANVDSTEISMFAWHTLQVCVRTSTTTTSRDGILVWWIDGIMRGRYTDLNYGNGNVNEWFWSETWDGYGNGKGYTGDVWIKVDHLRVSFPPSGGCATAAGGAPGSGGSIDVPAGAPGTVTGVTATVSGTQ